MSAQKSQAFRLTGDARGDALASFVNGMKTCLLSESEKLVSTHYSMAPPAWFKFDPECAETEEFFRLMEECRRNDFRSSIMEKQSPEGSGIMLDFDIELPHTVVGKKHWVGAVTAAFQVLDQTMDYPDESYLVAITSTGESNKFHILIPGLWLTRTQKKFVFSELTQNKVFQRTFSDVKVDWTDAFDTNCFSVPVLMQGCVRRKREGDIKSLHELRAVYSVESLDGQISVIPLNDEEVEDLNVVRELSLCVPGERTPALKADVKPVLLVRFREFESQLDDAQREKAPEFDPEEPIGDAEKMLREYLDRLPPVFSEKYKYWKPILKALAPDYRRTAVWFSKKCAYKWKDCPFDKHWEDALRTCEDYDTGFIFNLVRKHNPSGYEECRYVQAEACLENALWRTAQDNQICDEDVAEALYELGRDFFLLLVEEKGVTWYEFVQSKKDMRPGEIYKWRKSTKSSGKAPETMQFLLKGEKGGNSGIAAIGRKMHAYISSRADKEEDPARHKYLLKLKKNLQLFNARIRNSHRDRNVYAAVEKYFQDRGRVHHMDRDPWLLGVGNGVLKFYPNGAYELLTGVHGKLVSRFTECEFHEFSAKHPKVVRMFRDFRNMFLDEEAQSFWRLMYRLCQALDDNDKKRSLVIMYGEQGNNGKTVVIGAMSNVLGNDLSGTAPSSVWTSNDKNPNAAKEAELQFFGKRFVTTSELDNGAKFNMRFFKLVFGGGRTYVRGLYGKAISERPNAVVVMDCNVEPGIPDEGESAWKRAEVYEMKVQFYKKGNKYASEEYADPALSLFRREGSDDVDKYKSDPKWASVFLWILLQFYKSLHQDFEGDIDRVPSDLVDYSTERLREKQNTVVKFIMENLVVSPGSGCTMRLSKVCKNYMRWMSVRNRHMRPPNADRVMHKLRTSRLLDKFRMADAKDTLLNVKVVADDYELEDDEFRIPFRFAPPPKTPSETVDESLVRFQTMCESFLSNEELILQCAGNGVDDDDSDSEVVQVRASDMLEKAEVCEAPCLAKKSRYEFSVEDELSDIRLDPDFLWSSTAFSSI